MIKKTNRCCRLCKNCYTLSTASQPNEQAFCSLFGHAITNCEVGLYCTEFTKEKKDVT